MPTLTIGDQKVNVGDEFMKLSPEQQNATVDEIAKSLGTKAQQPSTISDVATSFGRGVAKDAIALAGLPGDVAGFVGKGVEKGGEMLGLAPRPVPKLSGLPTSEDIKGGVEGVIGELGKPKTTAGKYAESVGEFVPSALIGPGGPITKAATTIGGGLGAEAGGELGETFGHPEAGRFIGGFAGGVGAGVGAAETVERRLSKALPGQAKNYKASKAAYKMVQNAGVWIDPTASTQFIDGLDQTLQNNFITKAGVGAPIFSALDKARDGDLAELMDLHSRLGKIKPNRGELYEAAVIARPEIRDFIENLQHPQLISGNAQFVSSVWDFARDTWRTHAKLSEIEQAAEAADVRRLATGRGMNWNTFRQEFKKILLSDDKTRGYSNEAIEKIEKVVKGSLVQNVARVGSAMAPQRGALGAAPAAFALATGGIEAGGTVAVIGELSHFLEGYLTKRQIEQLKDLVKRESPLAPQQQRPDWHAIAPAAALRSELATTASSPLAQGP